MLAVVREPVVLAAVLGAVRVMYATILLWLASKERRQTLARVLDIGQAGVVIEHRGADGTLLTVRPTGRAVRARQGGRS
ncbi:MAG: hypothetical protein ACRDTA_30490 [Pseudonocardiaceae bacterium]